MSFRQYLAKHGFRMIDIEGDGNCLFRALSYHLHGTEDKHAELRLQIVQYMEEREEEFCNFQETEQPWLRYVHNMRQLGTFGGYLEIFVFACLYNMRVGVLQLNMPMHYISPMIKDADKEDKAKEKEDKEDDSNPSEIETIFLAFHDFQHFSALFVLK
jgi:OTU domain-containing protein 3